MIPFANINRGRLCHNLIINYAIFSPTGLENRFVNLTMTILLIAAYIPIAYEINA